MLFLKPRKRRIPFTNPAWDESIIDKIAKQSYFDVHVTVSTAIQGCRPFPQTDALIGESCMYEETEIHGVLTHPAFSLVNLNFSEESQPNGGWSYNRCDNMKYQDTEVSPKNARHMSPFLLRSDGK